MSKTTLKDKEKVTSYNMEAVDETDQLVLDPEILKEIEAKGLAYRWINAVKHKEMHGFDSRRWVPYKKEGGNSTVSAYGYADAEGYIRRGDMLLAVQPKHIAEARKQKIMNKNKTLQEMQQKGAASQLRESFKQAGIKSKVYEGYDENE